MNSRNNPPMIPGWTHVYSGKVRDLYVPEESRYDAAGLTVSDDAEIRAGSVMVVASDRISAFDKILPTEIPDKGKILTQMSLWWFQQLSHIPNHVISTDVPESVAGRAMICKSLNMFPVECIVRGYLTGSGLASYRDTGSIAGIELPAGLVDGSRLETPIFTPTGKAEVGQHDEPVTREELYAEVGHAIGNRLEELSLELYSTAEKSPASRALFWLTPKSNSEPIPTAAKSPSAMNCSPPTPHDSGMRVSTTRKVSAEL